MKRVYCLYRVSTKKQVDKNKNDIPMQRDACREFAARQNDWMIEKEYEEKGVSGYKVSASSRDAIQKLKEAAVQGEFDILLVFMFDRIGRIDDETPFVVEWFVKHGIEVWSSQEGQQRFENHTDKLLNYIRFWQASGESEKTSIRIRTRIQQMELEGLYTGGKVKFGYHLVDSGMVSKKGAVIKKLEIDETEAEIIHLMDDLTLNRGYGSWRLAQYLNEKGYRTHTGHKFASMSVIRILRDRYYCGCLEDGTTSNVLQSLKIREENVYRQLQVILDQREVKNTEKRQIALRTKGKAMLSGNIFCAHCGGRLTTIRYQDTYKRADGSLYKVDQIKYSCYHKSRKLCECDGQTTYQAVQVDEIVSQIIRKIFAGMSGTPEAEQLEEIFKRQVTANQTEQKRLSLKLKKDKEQLEKLQQEIGKALMGDSFYSSEDLASAIQGLKSRIAEADSELQKLKAEETQKRQRMEMITPEYLRFKSWADEFDHASLEEKKMISCQMFRRIEVGRGYQVSVEMNMTYQQFCSEWSGKSNMTEAVV